MRVEYKNTFLEFFRYQLSQQFRSWVLQVLVLLCSGYIAVDQNGYSKMLAPSIVVGIIVYAALWLFQILFLLVYLLTTKRKTLVTHHILTIDQEGLHEESAFNRTVHFWNGGIVKVRRRAGCIAIYVTALSAHLVPVRAFPSAEEARRFEHEVKVRSNAA